MCSDRKVIAVVWVVVWALSGSWAQTSKPAAQGTQVEPSKRASDDETSDFPPLPKGTVSLIGGTVMKLDPIRDRIVMRAFGGRDVNLSFDVRTKVLRDETAVSTREIRPGTRIYADTALVNGKIFAKTIRIDPKTAPGEANGQVTAFDPGTRKLRIRNALAAEPLEVQINPDTIIRNGEKPVEASQLVTGALVHVTFRAKADRTSSAQQIDILAQPGNTFTFVGKMTFVDLRAGYVAIADQNGANTYEVAVDHLTPNVKSLLKEGSDVVVHAKFDGQKYQAQSIEPAQGLPR